MNTDHRRSIDDAWSRNSSRVHLERFVERAAEALPVGGRMLDAGAGDGLYRRFFPPVSYESADFCRVEKKYDEITHVCDLRTIPVESGRYDLVLCSQVLEHLPEPAAVLEEFFRVLKPGGQLWLSAPLFYEEHEQPHDYFRYTQFGLRYLFDRAGFHVRELDWLEGYFGTLAYQLRLACKALPQDPDDYGGGSAGVLAARCAESLRPLFDLLAGALTELDLRHKFVRAGLCKNYTVVADKPHA